MPPRRCSATSCAEPPNDRPPVPQRHWRSHGNDPLPTGGEALDQPFGAFPSWFMRITCDRHAGRMGVRIEDGKLTITVFRSALSERDLLVAAIVSRGATGYQARMPGPRPKGERAMSVAERSAAYRARRKTDAEAAGKATVVRIRYRRPADKRSKPQRWQDAVQTLADLLDGYQDWRDSLPASLADSAIADRLDELLTLRDRSTSSPRPSCPRDSGATDAGRLTGTA